MFRLDSKLWTPSTFSISVSSFPTVGNLCVFEFWKFTRDCREGLEECIHRLVKWIFPSFWLKIFEFLHWKDSQRKSFNSPFETLNWKLNWTLNGRDPNFWFQNLSVSTFHRPARELAANDWKESPTKLFPRNRIRKRIKNQPGHWTTTMDWLAALGKY